MRRIYRFQALPPSDRWLLLRSALSLAAVRVELWVLPFRVVRGLCDRPIRHARPRRKAGLPSADRIAWAVEAASRYVPGAKVCLVKALAALTLLRRAGDPCRLCIGVTRKGEDRLGAHAWVECEGKVLVGGREAPHYVPLSGLEGKTE
jgi:hypothetical protein